jgi:hypothetical protein
MTEKESAEYGFMASYEDGRLCVSDSNGGGDWFNAYTHAEAAESIAAYIRRSADMLAESIADDLFDEDASDEDDAEDCGGRGNGNSEW